MDDSCDLRNSQPIPPSRNQSVSMTHFSIADLNLEANTLPEAVTSRRVSIDFKPLEKVGGPVVSNVSRQISEQAYDSATCGLCAMLVQPDSLIMRHTVRDCLQRYFHLSCFVMYVEEAMMKDTYVVCKTCKDPLWFPPCDKFWTFTQVPSPHILIEQSITDKTAKYFLTRYRGKSGDELLRHVALAKDCGRLLGQASRTMIVKPWNQLDWTFQVEMLIAKAVAEDPGAAVWVDVANGGKRLVDATSSLERSQMVHNTMCYLIEWVALVLETSKIMLHAAQEISRVSGMQAMHRIEARF